MQRIESRLNNVAVLHNRRSWDASLQTLGFWCYLDDWAEVKGFSRLGECDIGRLYVESHKHAVSPSIEKLQYYLSMVECHGFIHASSRRILDIWSELFTRLGLEGLGLCVSQPLKMSTNELLKYLGDRDLLLDHRHFHGPAYLDLTSFGQPLRSVLSETGLPNYLASLLRDLLAVVKEYDRIVLFHDVGIERDYKLVQSLLEREGVSCSRVSFSRIPVAGRTDGARAGGWEGNTVADVMSRVGSTFSLQALRIGVRLYFLHYVGLRRPKSFKEDELRACLVQANGLLAGLVDESDNASVLERFRRRDGLIDVYSALGSLMQRNGSSSVKRAVLECLL